MAKHRIAVVPGDGIGKEVMPEGLRVLDAAARKYNLDFSFDHYDWSCETYKKTGKMMPEDGIDRLRQSESVFLGAVGFPGVPDHISLWGLLIPIRRQFEQYINLRPVRMMKGIPCPLANRKPEEIDFWVVRENNEGEYSEIGGRLFQGTDREMAVQQSTFTRVGVDRVLRYAFDLAKTRKRKKVSSATKSNGIIHTMPYWDERVKEIAMEYPGVTWDQFHVDIRTGSTSSSAPTCSATFFPTSARRSPDRSASHRRRTSIPSASIPRCSSRCTARHPISPAKASPTRSARSGRVR
jgi:tartrate dehydrogenase/decarboxylase/D-malate dehydrogenase